MVILGSLEIKLFTQRVAQKKQNGHFAFLREWVKSHFSWRKYVTKFLCVKTVSGKDVRHSLA